MPPIFLPLLLQLMQTLWMATRAVTIPDRGGRLAMFPIHPLISMTSSLRRLAEGMILLDHSIIFMKVTTKVYCFRRVTMRQKHHKSGMLVEGS